MKLSSRFIPHPLLPSSWFVAEKLAKLEPRLKFALVEEYPTYDRLETMFVPL